MNVIIHSVISLHEHERVLIVEEKAFKYYAFISYSHKDKKTAKKLQVWLEHFHLPSKVIESHPELPKKLSPVFIDELNLVARDGSLSESLKGYLNESQYLILICSPSSAKSPYVNDEVDYFMNELKRGDRIIPLIVDGLPHAKDESIECFPPAILELDREHEPLGIDLRTFGQKGAFLRVMATLLKLEIDYFISRAEEERKKKAVIFSGATALIAAALVSLGWYAVSTLQTMQVITRHSSMGDTFYAVGNYAQAREFYKKAAANGDDLAQWRLGDMYCQGLGVDKDYAKAKEWYEKSAAQGNASAQYGLGEMYYQGLGVRQDYIKAAEYYEKAAAKGDSKAQLAMQDIVKQTKIGDAYSAKGDYAKASEWYEKAAVQDDVVAQVKLGDIYRTDKIIYFGNSYTKAVEWYEKAATQGHARAQYELAIIYKNGLGVKEDYVKAKEWYEKSADGEYAPAQYILGLMYCNGEIVSQDYAKAREWFEKAAAQGDTKAQYQLDLMNDREKDVKAIELAQNNASVQKNRGVMRKKDQGANQNDGKAREWYKKVAAQGIVTVADDDTLNLRKGPTTRA